MISPLRSDTFKATNVASIQFVQTKNLENVTKQSKICSLKIITSFFKPSIKKSFGPQTSSALSAMGADSEYAPDLCERIGSASLNHSLLKSFEEDQSQEAGELGQASDAGEGFNFEEEFASLQSVEESDVEAITLSYSQRSFINYRLEENKQPIDFTLNDSQERTENIAEKVLGHRREASYPDSVLHTNKKHNYKTLATVGILGQGAANVVSVARVQTLGGSFKGVAVNRGLAETQGMQKIMQMNERLANDPEAADLFPRVCHLEISKGNFVAVTRIVNGGEGYKVLGEASTAQRVGVLYDAGRGIAYLNEKKIIHRDIAYRNILVEIKHQSIPLQEAQGLKSAKFVFNQNGKQFLAPMQEITSEVKNQLREANIETVKVMVDRGSEQRPTGKVNDFDMYTEIENMPENLSAAEIKESCSIFLRFAEDVSPPEYSMAAEKLNQAIVNDNSEEIEAAWKELKQVSTPKYDSFSFGNLICDVMLRPGQKTNFGSTDSNGYFNSYTNKTLARQQEWRNDFHLLNDRTEWRSAISKKDHADLKKIHPELAQIAYNLMSYNPEERPDVAGLVQKLYSLSQVVTETLDTSGNADLSILDAESYESIESYSDSEDSGEGFDTIPNY